MSKSNVRSVPFRKRIDTYTDLELTGCTTRSVPAAWGSSDYFSLNDTQGTLIGLLKIMPLHPLLYPLSILDGLAVCLELKTLPTDTPGSLSS